ncbi:MAG: divalent-cation tolerance protein CutA [Methanomassiliicoccales archaeon]
MYSTVLVTVDSEENARRIARHLLDRGLTACANLFQMDSLFHWEGEVAEEPEWGMLLKTRGEDFREVESAVLEVHPYQVPCIVRYDIVEGHRPYLDWVGESTRG